MPNCTRLFLVCLRLPLKQDTSLFFFRCLLALAILRDHQFPETAQMAERYGASVSGAVDSSLIPSRVKPMTLNWYSQLPCLTLGIIGTVWRTSRQVYLLCRWERHLAGFLHLGVVDRWLATPKRARIAR